jgi:hypothetical protein
MNIRQGFWRLWLVASGLWYVFGGLIVWAEWSEVHARQAAIVADRAACLSGSSVKVVYSKTLDTTYLYRNGRHEATYPGDRRNDAAVLQIAKPTAKECQSRYESELSGISEPYAWPIPILLAPFGVYLAGRLVYWVILGFGSQVRSEKP